MSDKLHFAVNLDNSELRKDAKESRNIMKGIGDSAVSEGNRIDSTYKKIGGAMAALFTAQQASQLIRSIVQIRGEFQQLEIAFSTMLKSGERADKLMQDLVKFAVETPFGLQSSANAAKQLIAYGSAAETVVDELRMLGDVAAGTGQQIGDIVYLYGTLRTQGRAYTMDIRQFAGRGIPIYDELAKVMNVAKNEVNDLVQAGRIGFPEIEQAFKNMTSASGMYGGLMAKQAESVTGRIEQLKDAIDVMFNDIGRSSEGLTYSVISGAASIVENYEKIGDVLITLAATYGSYRAILIAVAAAERLNMQILRQAVLERKLAAAGMKMLSKEAAINIARTKTLTIAKKQLATTLKAVGKALIPNPYVLVAAAIGGLAVAIYKSITAGTAAEIAAKSLAKAQEERVKVIDEERSKISELINKLKDESTTRREKVEIIDELKGLYPDLFKNLDLENAKYLDLADSIGQVNEKLDAKAYRMMNDEIQKTINVIDKLKGPFKDFKVGATLDAMEILGIPKWQAIAMTGDQIREALEAHYSNLLEDRYKYEESLRKVDEQTSTESIKRNKKYWEDQKSEAEAGLNALDISLKGTQEWKNFEEQILRADRALKQYSVTARETAKQDPGLKPRDVGTVDGAGKSIIDSFLSSEMITYVAADQANQYSQKLKDSLANVDIKGVDIFDVLTSDLWNKAFSDLDKMAVSDMITLIRQLELHWKNLNLDPEEFKALREQIEKITDEIGTKNPFLGLSESIKAFKAGAGDLKDIAKNTGASLDQLGSMFSSITNGLKEMGIAGDEETQKMLNGIGEMIGGAATLAKGIASGNPAEIVAGGVQLLTSAVEVFDSKSRKANREIARLEGQLEILEERYNDLAKAIDKAYSGDAANLIRENEKLLKQQKVIIQKQLEAEKSKKKTDKEAVRRYEQAINDIDDQLAETEGKIVEAIFGQDVQSAIDEFARAYAEAFSLGEDAAAASAEVVKNMLKNALVESLKADIAPLVTDWMNLYTDYIADGIIDSYEQSKLDALKAEMDQKALKHKDGFEKYAEEESVEDDVREGAKKGFAAADQNSINELNGRFTALQQTASYIKLDTGQISENTKALMAVSHKLLTHLSNIDRNTSHLEAMKSEIKQIKTGIDDMNLKGVRLR